jgi:anion-transporting  ArsA/GET3 family ATPase
VKPVNVIVCVGGGGVGKTTTAAAIALALAQTGQRALIVTIDPARRLAGALGVTISDRLTPIPRPDVTGSLTALMPDPRRSMRTLIDYLFEHEPAARERVLKNPLYIGLCDAAAGVHELVAMNLVAQAAAQDRFDTIVIDTAPSRHAIDFVTYPGRLATLLGGRAVSWLANLTRRATTPPGARTSWLARATGQVEGLLARVTGPNLLRDTAALFADLALIRERFLELTRRASELLLGEHVAYALVAAPTAAARDDVRFLAERLAKLGRQPRVIIMNRAASAPGEWLGTLSDSAGLPAAIVEVLAALSREFTVRARAADAHVAELRRWLPRTPLLRLPYIEAPAPELVVAALAGAVKVHLAQLLPSE